MRCSRGNMSRTAPPLLVLLLLLLAAARGDDHHTSGRHPDAVDGSLQRLVRHRFTSTRAGIRLPHPVNAQSPDESVVQRSARERFERWFEKGAGDAGRSEPIDQMAQSPDEGRGHDDDEDRFVDPDQQGPAGTQSELSIAIDETGQHIVVAMNDFRGFSRSPLSISGFSYSDDGGLTFTDGGQLPVTVPTSVVQGQTFPQVFGDPEVKYLGGS